MMMLHMKTWVVLRHHMRNGFAKKIDPQEEHLKKMSYALCCKETMSLL
jgi:hypothetical protein